MFVILDFEVIEKIQKKLTLRYKFTKNIQIQTEKPRLKTVISN